MNRKKEKKKDTGLYSNSLVNYPTSLSVNEPVPAGTLVCRNATTMNAAAPALSLCAWVLFLCAIWGNDLL